MKNNCCPSTYSITNFIRLGFCWFRNNFFFRSLLLLCCWLLLLFSLLYVFFLSTVWSMVIFIVCFCYGVERKISNVHTHFIYWIHIIHLFAVCLLFWWVLCMHWLFSVILWNLHTKKNSNKTSTTTTTSTKWECEKTTTEWFWLDASLLNAIIK